MNELAERLTYRDIARRFGLGSPDAGRMRAKREEAKGRWRIIKGNHPSDPVHVEIPREDIPTLIPERPPTSDPTPPTPLLVELEREVPRNWLAAPLDMLALERERSAAAETALRAELEAHGETKARLAATAAERDAARRAHDDRCDEIAEADRIGAELLDRLRAERGRSWWSKLWNG